MESYFKLFNIPPSIKIEKSTLRERYLQLSKTLHPDYHVSGSEEDQAEALEASAQLNKAYRTLQSEDQTLRYLLMEKGILEDEEKYTLDPEFLMEMLELNEEVENADNEESRKAVEEKLGKVEETIYSEVKSIISGYDDTKVSDEDLFALKDYYFRKRYLQRLRSGLAQKP